MIQASTLLITPEMLSLVAEIDELKGAWRALGTLAPERLSALRRVATIESIGSSTRIEGGRLSDREVERLLSNLEIQSFGSRDEQEVVGYAEVMETVFASWAEISVTENHIKQLHRDLLRYSDRDERHRGEYQTASNSVAAFDADGHPIGVVFETASPFETHRGAGLDALADLLPHGTATPDAQIAREGRARASPARQAAGLGNTDPGPRPRPRPRHHRRRRRPTGASRNTLKLHFKTLRERGLLALHGQGRGAWCSLP